MNIFQKEQLANLLKHLQSYGKILKGVNLPQSNAEAADNLNNAAMSGNKGDVFEALKQTASTCSGCHKVYRLN